MFQPKDTDWLNGYKNNPYISCLQEAHLRPRDTYRLKMGGCKKIVHTNGNQKKARVVILILNKIDFDIKNITRDKERQSLHSDQGDNPRRRYKYYKYTCTQHRSTLIPKANANNY